MDYESEDSELVRSLPEEFVSFYRTANGLQSVWFNILPVFSKESPKSTWDSLSRANNPKTTRFFNGDPELLKRFIVFAEIGGGYCACIERDTGSIWFEDDDGIHETDMSLREFIEVTLAEVTDL